MRGYWLPPGHTELSYYDGFFVKSDAVYISDNPTRDWDMFMYTLKGEFLSAFPDFKIIQQWEDISYNQKVYVVMDNSTYKLIADDTDEYITVYLISAQTKFSTPIAEITLLKNILCKYYPKSVYQRINYRELKKIDGEKYG